MSTGEPANFTWDRVVKEDQVMTYEKMAWLLKELFGGQNGKLYTDMDFKIDKLMKELENEFQAKGI